MKIFIVVILVSICFASNAKQEADYYQELFLGEYQFENYSGNTDPEIGISRITREILFNNEIREKEFFEKIFESPVYYNHDILIEDTENWIFQNGLNKGDVIFVVGPKNIEIGDVIIFDGDAVHPLIHRVIETGNVYSTKGDNYKTNSDQLNSEKVIEENQLVGKALFKVPFIGWAKLIFFEGTRAPQDRGLCR